MLQLVRSIYVFFDKESPFPDLKARQTAERNSPSNWDTSFAIILDILNQVVRECLSPVATLAIGPRNTAQGAAVILVVVRLHYGRARISNQPQTILRLGERLQIYIQAEDFLSVNHTTETDLQQGVGKCLSTSPTPPFLHPFYQGENANQEGKEKKEKNKKTHYIPAHSKHLRRSGAHRTCYTPPG